MKILWLGNAPFTPSGYGEQANLFLPRLEGLGHEIAIAANWGLQGATLHWNDMTIYPSDGMWGNTTIRSYIDHHQADLTIALCDAWVLEPHRWPNDTRMAVWAPIDHHPIPPPVLAVLNNQNISPIAMTRNGERLMDQANLDPCYVPHGVDTKLFKPMPELREQAREALNLPQDAFLVGMVAANRGNPSIPRKGFPQAFHAFSQFARDHDDAYMYVHSQANPHPGGGGISLRTLAPVVGVPAGRIIFPADESWDIGMTHEHLAVLYSAYDVLLNPSMGEGFGIPIVEAQACGVPVIVSDHSAMTELCGAGWLVQGDPWWDALQQSFFIMPSIQSIHACLEKAYEARGDQELRDRAREFALGYDADTVTERFWVPALEKLTKPRTAPPLDVAIPINRKERRRLAKAGA